MYEKYIPLSNIEKLFKLAYDKHFSIFEIDKYVNIFDYLKTEQEREFFFKRNQAFAPGKQASLESFMIPGIDLSVTLHPRYLTGFPYHHDMIEIHYMLNGSMSHYVEENRIDLNPGDMCLLAPRTDQFPAMITGETLCVNIVIRKDILQTIFSQTGPRQDFITDFYMQTLYGTASSPFLICRTGEDTLVRDIILEMLEAYSEPDSYTNQFLMAKLVLFFIHLLRNHKTDFSIGNYSPQVDQKIIRILEYIQDHYRDASLSSMSKEFNYCEVYLSRLIHEYTGRTFSELVTELRMKHALSLLKETNLPVMEIAFATGYSDKSNFYKAFRKNFGQTPTEIRKQE